MIRLLLATGNAHKVDEVQHVLGSAYEVVAQDTGVAETGITFEENALIKARALAATSGELAVADPANSRLTRPSTAFCSCRIVGILSALAASNAGKAG